MAGRVSQVAALVLLDGAPVARVSQVAVLVLYAESTGITAPSIEATTALGTPTLAELGPVSIAASTALGTPALTGTIEASSIEATTALGEPDVYKADILIADGIAAATTLGAPTLTPQISAGSAATGATMGAPTLAGRLTVPAISAGTALGTPKLTSYVVMGDGIAATTSLGTPFIGGTEVTLHIMGEDRTGEYVSETMDITVPMSGPATATFTLYQTSVYKPLLGAEILFHFNGVRKFGGFIEKAKEMPLANRTREFYVKCSAVDYYAILRSRRVAYDYSSYTSLKALLEHLIANFLDGEGVGLAPMLDEVLDPAELNLVFRDAAVSQALERLAEQLGRDVWIDMHRMLHVDNRALVDSGFRVDPYAENWRNISVDRSTRNLRTVQGVTVQQGTLVTRREEHTATGNWLAFRADYAISEETRPRIWRNDVAQDVIFRSEMGSTAGLVMVEDGSRDIHMLPGVAGQTNPSSADEWIIEYVPFVETDTLWSQNDSLIAARAARSNTSGRIEAVTDTAGLITADGATGTADAYLSRYRDQMEIMFESDAASANLIDVGKSIEVDVESPFVKGTYVVTRYGMKDQTTFMRYRVTAAGPEPFRIIGASNAMPIVIETEIPHGLTSGQTVTVAGVLGNTAANVSNWPVRVESATTFRLPGLAGNGAYAGGGYLLVNVVSQQRRVASVTGAGVSPIIITTTDPHDFIAPGGGDSVDDFTGWNWRDFPVGSVDSMTGNTAANGTGYTLIPISETQVALGPLATGPGQDIASWTRNGSTITVTTEESHNLTTGDYVVIELPD